MNIKEEATNSFLSCCFFIHPLPPHSRTYTYILENSYLAIEIFRIPKGKRTKIEAFFDDYILLKCHLISLTPISLLEDLLVIEAASSLKVQLLVCNNQQR